MSSKMIVPGPFGLPTDPFTKKIYEKDGVSKNFMPDYQQKKAAKRAAQSKAGSTGGTSIAAPKRQASNISGSGGELIGQ